MKRKINLFLAVLISLSLVMPLSAYGAVINGFDTSKTFNVALSYNGSTISSTSNYSTAYPATNLVDGVTTTQWLSSSLVAPSIASPQTVAVKFNGPKSIYKVRWKSNSYTPNTYQIQYAVNNTAVLADKPDSPNWASVTNMTNGDGGFELTNGSVSGNQVTNNLYNAANTVISHTFDVVEAHGLRMIITAKNGTKTYVSMTEFEVYGNYPGDKYNVGLSYNGGVANATSYNSATYTPVKVNDGPTTTAWLSANIAPTAIAPHVVGYKFKNQMTVDKVRWLARNYITPQTPKTYEIQYAVNSTADVKDGVNSPNWTPVTNMTNGDNGLEMTDGTVTGNIVTNNTYFQPTTAVSHNFAPVKAYGLRMIIKDKNGTTLQYVAVGELQVYGNYDGLVVPNEKITLSDSNLTSTSVTLTWNAISSQALTGYKIYMDGLLKATVDPGQTSYEVTGLEPGKTYIFTATYETSIGESVPSNQVSVTTPVIVIKPTGLKATNVTPRSLSLSWDPVDTADLVGYNIYNNGQLIGSVPGNQTSADVLDLMPLTTYKFEVTFLTTAGNESPKSDPLTVTTPTEEKLVLKASNIKATSLTLSWNAVNVPDLKGYNIYKDGQFIATTTSTQINANITGLTPKTTYTFEVSYVTNSGFESPKSDPIKATTTGDTTGGVPGGGTGQLGRVVQSGTLMPILSGSGTYNINITNSTLYLNINVINNTNSNNNTNTIQG